MSHYEKAWQAVAERIERAVQAAGRAPDRCGCWRFRRHFRPMRRAVHAAGQRSFGENHVQEGAAKRQATADLPDVVWHLIGPLQGNKTRLAARNLRLGGKRGPPEDRAAAVGAATDGSPASQRVRAGERQRRGVEKRRRPDEALALALAIADLPRIRVRGIMGIPAAYGRSGATADAISPPAANALETLRDIDAGLPLDTLSMGMSADLEAAIAEGSTQVRVGTAIFGAR